MRQRKLIGPALILLVLFATAAQAQVSQEPAETVTSSRSWIIQSFYNTGSQGGWNVGSSATGEPQMFMYPGWNSLPSTNATSNYTRKNGNSLGFGLWILSRDGSQVKMSWSGPRYKADDIRQIVYDPSKGPEAKLGVTTAWEQSLSASFTEASNYWSGAAVPKTGPPEKIWNFSPGKYIPDDANAEEIIISKWTNAQGITVTRKAYAWSYPDFADFIIEEHILENTGDVAGTGVPSLPDKPVEDVYVAFLNTWSVSEMGNGMRSGVNDWFSWPDRARDDWFKYTEAGNYVKGSPGGPTFIDPSEAKGLKLAYQFDGKSPFSGYDDTGEPWLTSLQSSNVVEMGMVDNQMTSYQFVGMAPVAYADDAGIHSFNAQDKGKYVQPKGPQPAFVNRWAIRGNNDYDEPTPASHTPATILNTLTSAAVVDNPTDVGGFTNAQVYGPYTLARGQQAKIVVVYAAGTGAEYAGPGQEPIDPWQWALTATKNDLGAGERALVTHVRHALFAYQSGYDVPDPPPDVDVVVQSDENARALLTWSAAGDKATNPDYKGAEANDVAGYRIYRGLRGNLTSIGPFNLVATIPVGGPYPSGVTFAPNAIWPDDAAGTNQSLRTDLKLQGDQGRRVATPGIYSWSDPNSNAGFTYWYSVRTYAKAHTTWTNNDASKTIADLPARVQTHLKKGLESGYSSMLQKFRGSPVLPKVAAADRLERDIVVAPNPYKLDGTHNYVGGVKIRFLNVPERAHIFIFNAAGQLVQSLRKTDPSRSEISWDGRPYTTTLAQVGPGIYFYVVKSDMPGEENKHKTGTFVVIR